MRNPLKWRVDCKDRFWEPIAAFNCEHVAGRYASDCATQNGKLGLQYRVIYRGKITWQSV